MTEMEDAFNGITEHVSDKWSSYFRVYEHYFSRFKDAPIHLLEVGVQNGGSMEAWSRYFKHATNIVGCDINPKCADLNFSDTRIKIVNGDINKGQTKSAIQAISAQYDVIIDDGSHNSPDIIQSFIQYYGLLKPGGVYLIEDLHASYWKQFHGGLWRDTSAMEFFKRLVDILNYESWGVELPIGQGLPRSQTKLKFKIKAADFSTIDSIHFHNSICVVIKGYCNNTIGHRVINGQKASVFDGLPETGSGLPMVKQPANARMLGIRQKTIRKKR